MGKVLRIDRFSRKRCNYTAAVAKTLGIEDIAKRNEEFMHFLATERSRHLSKVEQLDRLMKTIADEWGIEPPLAGPEGR